MRNLSIGPLDAGQRLDKFLLRYFREAENGFLYRMLRKKNITLNGKKASGSEKLAEGDTVNVFFSEETFEKFRGKQEAAPAALTASGPATAASPAVSPAAGLAVVYEDRHILLVSKPAGLLTQKGESGDESLTDRIAAYVNAQGGEHSEGFTPAAANRLDRNTSGLVLAGKTLPGQQLLSFLLREGKLEKYYICVACGVPKAPIRSRLYWKKDGLTNTVSILDRPETGAVRIELSAEVLESYGEYSLLRVQLISGKSHQIRAQLAHLGYPILGDGKYCPKQLSQQAAARLEMPIRHQLLHSREVVFPPAEEAAPLSARAAEEWRLLAGKRFEAPLPKVYGRVISGLGGSYGQ